MTLEHSRKDAKALVRAVRAGDPEAVARVRDVTAYRNRFQLSDAQHVVAVERGYRTWPELKHALETAEHERPVARIGLQPVSFYEKRARALADDPDAVRRVRAHVARLADWTGGGLDHRDAKLVVAREYGFDTWRELVATVERVRAVHEGQREGSPPVLAALDAIRAGDVDALRALLDERPELAGHVHDGAWSTLLEAIAEPDVIGEYLGVELGTDPRVVRLLCERSDDLDNPLNLAACFNRAELVRLLLDAGAEPAPDPARGLTPLETALFHGAREAADLLAERGISPLALWTAAGLGRVELLAKLLDTPEAAAHRPNLADVGWPPGPPAGDDGQTLFDEALCHAAHNGRDDAVAWLLAHGADVDGAPYLGVTPLHFAAQFGHGSTVRLLLEHGADTTLRDRIHDATPVDWARESGRPEIESLLDKSVRTIDSGLEYTPGDPVLVKVVRRGRNYLVTDDGAAVARTGQRPGWRDAAQRAMAEDALNLSREGAVFVPARSRDRPIESLAERVAKLSLAVYQEILDLD
jgi:hypothetical protein